MLLPTLLVSLLRLASVQAATSSNPDDPSGQVLYITSPACGFFRCSVTWMQGATVAINWLLPPPGNVSIALASNTGGAVYTISPSYPSISQAGYCDSGYGLGTVAPGVLCGRVEFVVPGGWVKAANYTVVVTSLTNSQYVGYTDAITVVASNTTNVVPAGTAVSFLTIPAPTTTNLGASVSNTAVIPAPTAVTSGANTAKTTTAAMGGSGGAPVTAAGQTVASTAGAAGAAATTAAAKSGATMGRQVSLLAWVGGAVLLGMA